MYTNPREHSVFEQMPGYMCSSCKKAGPKNLNRLKHSTCKRVRDTCRTQHDLRLVVLSTVFPVGVSGRRAQHQRNNRPSPPTRTRTRTHTQPVWLERA